MNYNNLIVCMSLQEMVVVCIKCLNKNTKLMTVNRLHVHIVIMYT